MARNEQFAVFRRVISVLAILLSAAAGLRAQTDSLLTEGDRRHRTYRFEEALELYARALAGTADTDSVRLIRDRMDRSQNALNMTDFCADPVVVARERFSRKDFFLFYPLKNQTWRLPPHSLDPSEDGFPTYAPRGGQSLCFSAPDAAGSRNLYVSRSDGSKWSVPELMGEHLLSPGNEVFPMLSEDGKKLTFSSDGFHGMGGYDLYTSTWNEEAGTWGAPQNMGFPFSSPGDDFLLVDSPDGRYTLFASNRDCSRDSVYIYVLEKQQVIPRVPMRDPVALARTASLVPLNDPKRLDNGAAVSGEEAPGNDNTRRYMQMTAEARVLRDSIYAHEQKLDSLRLRLSSAAEDRTALTSAIAEREAALSPLRLRLDETSRAIRSIEQAFLLSGAVTDSGRADREFVGAGSSYTFSRNAPGAKLKLNVEAAPPAAPATFRVGPIGRFAQDTTLPEGLVYQILLFTSPRHATLDEIKGLDPVYERLTNALRYTYSVGIFRTFNDALLQLNPVRVLGFPDAEIVAYQDGKPIAVSLARRSE